MLDFSQEEQDFNKCHRVIRSCRTLSHATVAVNMVHNFGRAYGYNVKWQELDVVSKAVWYFMTDESDDVRCRSVQEETDMIERGRKFWIKRYL